MGFKDDELTLDELKEITAGIIDGKTDEMLDKLSKPELKQFKDVVIKERELSMDELDNVKVGQPLEMVEEMTKKNPEIFINK